MNQLKLKVTLAISVEKETKAKQVPRGEDTKNVNRETRPTFWRLIFDLLIDTTW